LTKQTTPLTECVVGFNSLRFGTLVADWLV